MISNRFCRLGRICGFCRLCGSGRIHRNDQFLFDLEHYLAGNIFTGNRICLSGSGIAGVVLTADGNCHGIAVGFIPFDGRHIVGTVLGSGFAGHIRSKSNLEGLTGLGCGYHDLAGDQLCGNGIAAVTVFRHGDFLATHGNGNRVIVVIIGGSERVIRIRCCCVCSGEALRQSYGITSYVDHCCINDQSSQRSVLDHRISGVVHPCCSDLDLSCFHFQRLEFQGEGHGTGASVLTVTKHIDLAVLYGNRHTGQGGGSQLQNCRIVSKADVECIVAGFPILVADTDGNLHGAADCRRGIRRHLYIVTRVRCCHRHGTLGSEAAVLRGCCNGCGSLCQGLDHTVRHDCCLFIGGSPDDRGIRCAKGFNSGF